MPAGLVGAEGDKAARLAGDFERASFHIEQAAESARESFAVLFERGKIARATGETDSAIDDFTRASAAADTPGQRHSAKHFLGVALTDAGRPSEAVSELRESLTLEPVCPACWWAYADAVSHALGESAIPKELMEVQIDAGAGDAREIRCDVLAHRGFSAETVSELRSLLDDGWPVLNDLGLALVHAGEYGEASNAFRRLLSEEPDSIVATYNLTIALTFAGAKDETDDLENLLAEHDDLELRAYALSGLEAARGRHSESLVALREAAAQNPRVARFLSRDPAWNALRHKAEFQAIVDELRHPAKQSGDDV